MKKYTPENPVFSAEFNIIERADLVNAQSHNASVMQLMDNEVALKNQIDNCLGSMEGDKPQFADGIKSDNVVDAVNEVFGLCNENKQKLVDNLIAMGVQASTSETWKELLNKVLDMTDTSSDTVTAPVLLTGYTAHDASGEQIEGDMPEMAAVTVEATSTTQDDSYTYLGLPEGHYSEESKVRTKNSNLKVGTKTLAKIVSGRSGDSVTQTIDLSEYVSYKKITENNILPVIYKVIAPSGYSMNTTVTNPTINNYDRETGSLSINYTVKSNNNMFDLIQIGVYVID